MQRDNRLIRSAECHYCYDPAPMDQNCRNCGYMFCGLCLNEHDCRGYETFDQITPHGGFSILINDEWILVHRN